MSCVSITLLLCLATMLLAQVTCQISGVSNCLCLKTSNRVLRKEMIESYMIQKAGVCHIDAILFKAASGLTFCSNPQKPWVKRATEFVDNKWSALETTAHPLNSAPTSKTALTLDTKAIETTAHLINSAPTFTTASTLDTASDWNGQDELRTTAPELLEYVYICL
uniref:Chemokine interleukin-8-like domain-containing protein n=1 Tax=Sinocyclocheilus anshuiensis TaxID=1608454 RepID=A0A671N0T4_9TELE